ncbi:small integral membrane protein 28-like [Megalobrama amblycephala]|uniref:small integral membrane protein 28-like n=1 Tax=Megalobrama amblycephala TaxID=75352 RepID=UPI00201450E5|nr:small integral membrane protein 28-like [Megalobrama amblycephala]
MRVLMDSSWIQFGPAGRGSYDWVAGASASPSTENRLKGYWNELASNKVGERAEETLYVAIITGSLLFLIGIALFVYRRCFRVKENTAKVITLDFDDANGTAEFLSTLEEGDRAEEESDGVFLMVYLPAPYEKTLTKIARAASTSSSHNEVEIVELDTENSTDQE